MSHDRVGPRAVMRSVAFLAAGVLAVPLLAGCGEEDPAGKPLAGQDIAPATRDRVADGGTLRWAVDAVPETLNAYQADADATTARVTQAVLPSMYRLDVNGRPARHADFLESADVVAREPKQVVVYKLHPRAVWSDGRAVGAADFTAQWRALSGRDTAYWTARNAGYDRIERVVKGSSEREVRVTFARPYADWKSLFSPLYPKQIMGRAEAFNDDARRKLAVTAGPFIVKEADRKGGEITLARNSRWWGRPAKLDRIVLKAVPREKRTEALTAGRIDVAEIDTAEARRIALAGRPKGTSAAGPGATLTPAKALRSRAVAHGSDKEAARDESGTREKRDRAIAEYAREQKALRAFEVRKSLEPSYTQLALNGADGPLADERVRRAVARALDRKELASLVLAPLGLPAEPVGSHLALAGQAVYADGSGALGGEDTKEAQALLADAGWVPGRVTDDERKKAAGSESGSGAASAPASPSGSRSASASSGESDGSDGSGESGDSADSGRESADESSAARRSGSPSARTSSSSRSSSSSSSSATDDGEDGDGGDDGKNGRRNGKAARDHGSGADREDGEDGSSGSPSASRKQARTGDGAMPGAYAPIGTAAPAGARQGPLSKDGKPLSLKFVLPSGPGSQPLRTVGERIARMLERVGIRTEVTKVSDANYFKDHIANGQYDLALYSWPMSAFPATDARPIYAKPVPAADGSLSVEQNYTRVGTDQVDQLFDQAIATLDEDRARSLMRKADARIWAAAGSIPLYQRPQVLAVRTDLANTGAFGFQTPVHEDMGFLKKSARPAPKAS